MVTMHAYLPVQRHRWTIEAYHKLADYIFDENARVELIEGEIYDMAPIGSLHAGKLERLRRLLEQAIGDRALVFSQNPVALGTHSEPQPDIAILIPRQDFYEAAHPGPDDILLLIELADSSIDYDRGIKIPFYARYQIPEVWLVSLKEKCLEAYHGPAGDEYQYVDFYREGLVPLQSLPDVVINLDGFF